MRSLTSRTSAQGLPAALLIVLMLAATVPRYARLGADFPAGMTSSEAPYTDEGWYSNSAVRHLQRGVLFVDHDVNEARVMPLFHLVQRVGFAVGGMSFESIRAVAQTLFLLLSAALSLLLFREAGAWAAALAAGLLLTNFTLFAYSRLALVELPMLLPLVVGLLLVRGLSPDRELPRGVVAGGAVAAAALFKLSALFAGPVFLLIALGASRASRDRTRLVRGLAGFALGASAAALVWLPQLTLHREDLLHSFAALVAGPQRTGSLPLTTTVQTALTDFVRLDPPLVLALAIASVLTLTDAWRERADTSPIGRLDFQLLLLVGSAWAVPAATKYQPTRYFVPVLALTIALAALHCGRAVRDRSRRALLLLAPLCLSALFGTYQSINHLLNSPKTYKDATIRMREHFGPASVLMGDAAPQIAIETNVWAISGNLGRGDLEDRVRRHRPTHFVARGPLGTSERETLASSSCEVRLLDRYNVFGNPTGRPLHLYELSKCRWSQVTPSGDTSRD